ncbi:MAG TPA: baseplate J/gp47 family protein [Bacillota bacterium]
MSSGIQRIPIGPELRIEQLVKLMVNSTEKQLVLEVPLQTEPGDTPDGTPVGAALFHDEINLRLLKFYAEEAEKDFVIATTDPVVAALAKRLGIPTWKEDESRKILAEKDSDETVQLSGGINAAVRRSADEMAAAPESATVPVVNSTGISRGERQSGRGFIPAVLIALFTITLAVWWFFQPKAIVTVYPKVTDRQFLVTARTSSLFRDDQTLTGKLPANILEKTDSIQVQTVATGKKNIGVTPATGKVLFTNSSNQPVVLPKGSILMGRAGVRYLTDGPLLVPAKKVQYDSGIEAGVTYGRAEVTVTAAVKGVIGNQPAKSITLLEGKFGRVLKVTNPTPTKNGADKQISVVTLEDTKKGDAEAREQMGLLVPDAVSGLVGQDYLYLPELVKNEVLQITYGPDIGAEADTVQTNLEYRIAVLAPYRVEINKLLNHELERLLPAGFQSTGRPVETVSAKVISSGTDWADLELSARGQIRGVLDQDKIKKLIGGQSLGKAKTILLGEEEIATSQINLKTGGDKLPRFPFQIKVIFPAGARAR